MDLTVAPKGLRRPAGPAGERGLCWATCSVKHTALRLSVDAPVLVSPCNGNLMRRSVHRTWRDMR